jgi:hypothetical protein
MTDHEIITVGMWAAGGLLALFGFVCFTWGYLRGSRATMDRFIAAQDPRFWAHVGKQIKEYLDNDHQRAA